MSENVFFGECLIAILFNQEKVLLFCKSSGLGASLHGMDLVVERNSHQAVREAFVLFQSRQEV